MFSYLSFKICYSITCRFLICNIFQLHQHYTCHPHTPETLDSIEEQRSAFELAEQSSPGITEHFILLIFNQLNTYESDDFVKAYLDRLARMTKSWKLRLFYDMSLIYLLKLFNPSVLNIIFYTHFPREGEILQNFCMI